MRQTFNEVVALSVFINVLALALPIVTLQIYDRVISHNGISTLQGLVVGTIIVVLFDFVLRQGRSRILQNVALRADVYVSRELFTKFMSLPLKTLENQPSAYWLSLFNDVDVILTPTTPTPAFPLGAEVSDPITMYLNDVFTVPANLAGLPGISVPAGLSKQGLPLGLQLLAPSFEEGRLFSVANAIEKQAEFLFAPARAAGDLK